MGVVDEEALFLVLLLVVVFLATEEALAARPEEALAARPRRPIAFLPRRTAAAVGAALGASLNGAVGAALDGVGKRTGGGVGEGEGSTGGGVGEGEGSVSVEEGEEGSVGEALSGLTSSSWEYGCSVSLASSTLLEAGSCTLLEAGEDVSPPSLLEAPREEDLEAPACLGTAVVGVRALMVDAPPPGTLTTAGVLFLFSM